MCPVCIAAAALIAAKATGGGGVSAFVAGKVWKKRVRNQFRKNHQEKEIDHGNGHSGTETAQRGFAQRVG